MRKTKPKPKQPNENEMHFVILVADLSLNLGKKGRIKSSKIIRAAEFWYVDNELNKIHLKNKCKSFKVIFKKGYHTLKMR